VDARENERTAADIIRAEDDPWSSLSV